MIGRFLSELKKRNVIRVAGLYTVTAWGLFQVFKTVADTLDFPKWASPTALVLLALGLPITLVVAWAFERGPDGEIHRTPATGAKARVARLSWPELGLLAGVVLVLIASVAQMGGTLFRIGDTDKSVAVLPFVNFSQVQDSGYFADGLTEEIINSLAQAPELKVAGRTSSFYFKGRNEDLRQIGRDLGVANVVEGSVRREGDRLRVTAQLISVKDGFHLWSMTYDRHMDDAFRIQTDIANAVADALKLKLAPQSSQRTGRDPQAYQLETIARAHLRNWGLQDLTTARDQFQRLLVLEPDNAAAYAGLAEATILLMQNYTQIDFATARQEAEPAAARAVQLDPNSATAWDAKGWLDSVLAQRGAGEHYVDDAEAAFKRALALEPRNPDALEHYGAFLTWRRRPEEGLVYLRRAVEIDPLNRVAQTALGAGLAQSGHLAEAERQYRSTIQLHPDFVDPKLALGQLLVDQGRLAEGETWMRAAVAPGDDPTTNIRLIALYVNLRMPDAWRRTADGMAVTAVGAVIRDGLPLLVNENYPGLVAFADQQIAKGEDPLWHTIAMSGAMLAGDTARARKELELVNPGLFNPEPAVDAGSLTEALDAAALSAAQGDHDRERRIVAKVLAIAAPRPGRWDSPQMRIFRVRAYAELGDHARAVAEMKAAVDAGYRTLWDVDLIRLERYPNMASVRNDPAFLAQIARIDADVARQRAQVQVTHR